MIERRFDPAERVWRTLSTDRQERTYLPPTEECPLCPTRPGAPVTEIRRETFEIAVFDNRFPPFVANAPAIESSEEAMYEVAPATGAAEVVVYTDDHEATLGALGSERIEQLAHVWADRYSELGARADVEYVFIFENRGAEVGVTLSHPHGQIYAFPEIPPRARRKLEQARLHLEENGTCVFCDIVAQEHAAGVRVVRENESFVAFAPFAGRFAYEVHVLPRRHATSLIDLTDPERASLAQILAELLPAYDALFGFPLPYVMAIHQAPTDDGLWLPVSHLQIEFTPVHRSATRLKYLAGSELGAGAFINDVRPEDAATALRAAFATA